MQKEENFVGFPLLKEPESLLLLQLLKLICFSIERGKCVLIQKTYFTFNGHIEKIRREEEVSPPLLQHKKLQFLLTLKDSIFWEIQSALC